MNLLETIKHYNIKFPENAKYAVQDKDGEIKFALSDSVQFTSCGIWTYPLATDYNTAIIANPNQQGK